MARHKNENWNLPAGTPTNGGGKCVPYDAIKCSLLMDIRDELQQLNALLHCPNFTGIPKQLRAIHRKMPPRRKKK